MMADIEHMQIVKAAPEQVYAALTTQNGLAEEGTQVLSVAAAVGDRRKLLLQLRRVGVVRHEPLELPLHLWARPQVGEGTEHLLMLGLIRV